MMTLLLTYQEGVQTEVCVSDSRNVDLVINVSVRNRVPDTSPLTFSGSIYEFSELFCLPALSDVGIGRCPITTDFESERKFKLGLAERVALKDTKGMMDHATRGEQTQKEEELRMRKVALNISEDVKNIPLQELPAIEYKDQTDANGCTEQNGESQSNILDTDEDYMSEIEPARPPGSGKSTLLLALTGKLDTSLEGTSSITKYFHGRNQLNASSEALDEKSVLARFQSHMIFPALIDLRLHVKTEELKYLPGASVNLNYVVASCFKYSSLDMIFQQGTSSITKYFHGRNQLNASSEALDEKSVLEGIESRPASHQFERGAEEIPITHDLSSFDRFETACKDEEW
ncbi:hypothetical protein Tco_1304184 [Tanacetum coccineum]